MPEQPTSTLFLQRPDGRIAYELIGQGPLVLCVAGMGDLRSSYRYLAPGLVTAGYRVALMDLRGHGDSDTTFSAYDDVALASDMTALLQELGEPATIIGNSMAAAAGVIVAAEQPELVRDLVLISPFVRDPKNSKFVKPFLNFLTLPLWAPATFNAMLPQWFKGDKPADYAAYRQKLIESIKRPGYRTAFSRTTRTSHDPAEQVIHRVRKPSLTLMGKLDPDFPNAVAEMEWITQSLNGQGHMLANASHYPQSQQPEQILEYVLPFMKERSNA